MIHTLILAASALALAPLQSGPHFALPGTMPMPKMPKFTTGFAQPKMHTQLPYGVLSKGAFRLPLPMSSSTSSGIMNGLRPTRVK